MKFIKKIVLIIFIVAFIAFLGSAFYYNYWRSKNTKHTFRFLNNTAKLDYTTMYWKDGNIGEISVKKTALFVKVHLNGNAQDYFMQLDTGTPSTVFYGKVLAQLKKELVFNTFYAKDSTPFVKNMELQIANSKFSADRIKILQQMGITKIDTSFIVIGTLGFDSFVDRTLVLDFKKDRLAITNKSLKAINYPIKLVKNASVSKFPVLIPAKINGEKVRFFYDSGSSMFSVLTSNKNLAKLQPNDKIDTLCCVQNWDKQFKVFRKKLRNKIEIENLKEETEFIYSIDKMNIVNYFPNWFMYGITGNTLFNDKLIIIDTKNNLFGISN